MTDIYTLKLRDWIFLFQDVAARSEQNTERDSGSQHPSETEVALDTVHSDLPQSKETENIRNIRR